MAEATAAAIAPETDIDAIESVKEQLRTMQAVRNSRSVFERMHERICIISNAFSGLTWLCTSDSPLPRAMDIYNGL